MSDRTARLLPGGFVASVPSTDGQAEAASNQLVDKAMPASADDTKEAWKEQVTRLIKGGHTTSLLERGGTAGNKFLTDRDKALGDDQPICNWCRHTKSAHRGGIGDNCTAKDCKCPEWFEQRKSVLPEKK